MMLKVSVVTESNLSDRGESIILHQYGLYRYHFTYNSIINEGSIEASRLTVIRASLCTFITYGAHLDMAISQNVNPKSLFHVACSKKSNSIMHESKEKKKEISNSVISFSNIPRYSIGLGEFQLNPINPSAQSSITCPTRFTE